MQSATKEFSTLTITADQVIKLDEVISGTPDASANAGYPLDRAPLPYWQDRPCPSWCVLTIPHQDSDMGDDRYHGSSIYQMDLTIQETGTCIDGETLVTGEPFTLNAGLHQDYREHEPRVYMIVDEKTDIYFTVSEATEIARHLTTLADSESTASDHCPSWCTTSPHADPSIGDRDHLGDYADVILTCHDADVRRPPAAEGREVEPVIKPCSILARLAQGWREREAWVTIVYRDEYIDLTLAETEEHTVSGIASLLGVSRQTIYRVLEPASAS